MMKLITEELLNETTLKAKASDRLRMNHNLHTSIDASVHRLLNALEPGTYIVPHRHLDKEETYLILRGSLLAFLFDDNGNVTDKVLLSQASGNYGLEIPPGTWHTIIALESGTMIFEVKSGPYTPLQPEEIAGWAPTPSDTEKIAAYMKSIAAI